METASERWNAAKARIQAALAADPTNAFALGTAALGCDDALAQELGYGGAEQLLRAELPGADVETILRGILLAKLIEAKAVDRPTGSPDDVAVLVPGGPGEKNRYVRFADCSRGQLEAALARAAPEPPPAPQPVPVPPPPPEPKPVPPAPRPPAPAPHPRRPGRARRSTGAWVVFVAGAVLLAWWFWRRQARPPLPLVGAPVALPTPAAPITSVFRDDFARAELGPDWVPADPAAVHLESGSLVVLGGKRVWLMRPLPEDAAIDFHVWAEESGAAFRVEGWGDARSGGAVPTGYVFSFGGVDNLATLSRLSEPPLPALETIEQVVAGHRYHWRILRQGGEISWLVDGKSLLGGKGKDQTPLSGATHQYLALSGGPAAVHFAALIIAPENGP